MTGRVCMIALIGYTVGDLPDSSPVWAVVKLVFTTLILVGLLYSLLWEHGKP